MKKILTAIFFSWLLTGSFGLWNFCNYGILTGIFSVVAVYAEFNQWYVAAPGLIFTGISFVCTMVKSAVEDPSY